jgi:hypothetical protein
MHLSLNLKGNIWDLRTQSERKFRSTLTILMVLVGSSQLVAVNPFGEGITDFLINK